MPTIRFHRIHLLFSIEFSTFFGNQIILGIALEQALKKLSSSKDELLLVLKRHEIPLHNNTSERDIREYVTKGKISGSTTGLLNSKCCSAENRITALTLWRFLLPEPCKYVYNPYIPWRLRQTAVCSFEQDDKFHHRRWA